MPDNRITVHVIANAHLDPVWLWPWQAGLDEVLATCRTMCDLLDDYPDAIFTAGEAWRYWQIEQVDPPLLKRIQQHVARGRWALVGGWWIQPDCNFPSGFAMERQIAAGKQFFLDRFGTFPEVGFNVDTFGHAASLPGILRSAGQKFYVMMRPQEHEMALPARLFRWRGSVDSPEVLTFRIPGAYGTWGLTPTEKEILRSLENLPDGVTNTMCFIGVGDHGGGPSAKAIEWIRRHAESFPQCRLVFSSPSRFFDAIAPQWQQLPLVTGELQYHAIGCYTVMRGIKTRVRRAEHLLRQAQQVALPEQVKELDQAWQHVAFTHFHDILGGTSIPSAYPQHYDQLGAAASVADTILHQNLRRKMLTLPSAKRQRIVLLNASDSPYEGYVQHEPWPGQFVPSNIPPGLLDESGNAIPCQTIPTESVNIGMCGLARLLWRTRLAPGEMKVVEVTPARDPVPSRVTVSPFTIATDAGIVLDLEFGMISLADGNYLAIPRLDCIADTTDNWSHDVDRYPEGPICSPLWDAPCVLEAGPLMACLLRTGRIGDSELTQEWRVYADEPFVEMHLTVNWRQRAQLLKLTLPLDNAGPLRTDGIPGTSLERPNDGRECPMRDWTRLATPQGHLALVSPDIYAVDALPWRARFTLLRSPIMTQNGPFPRHPARSVYADQGEHNFRVRFVAGSSLEAADLDHNALTILRPVLTADLTRGMPRD